jgi:hypothetical protein
MDPVDADRLFTGPELARVEARVRANLLASQPAPAAAVRQTAQEELRLLREVHRARRFIAHVARLAEDQGLLRPAGAPPDESGGGP